MRLLALLLLLVPMSASAAALETGQSAPEFRLVDADGKNYTLAAQRGKRGVVLAWFPKPFTPG